MSKSTLVSRCAQAFAALAIVSTFVSGPFAAVASAEPAASSVQQAPEATVEERIAAARLIGLSPTPEQLAKSDLSFVIYLWKYADRDRDVHVRKAAEAAFINFDDPEACTRFIVRDIYTAHELDKRQPPVKPTS